MQSKAEILSSGWTFRPKMGKVAGRQTPGELNLMLPRIVRILPFLTAAAILCGSGPAHAFDHPGSLAKKLLAPRVDGSVAVVDKVDDIRMREIYQILCGGAAHLESGLSDHLWRVAESLAVADWKPPKVTIRVVVRPLDRP